MQTPKASSSETPLKISPRAVRQLKTTTLETTRASSSNLASRTPRDRSPKINARGSPKSPASEKKRPSKILELESQISQLQEELKTTKDQLTSSKSCKIKAEENEEELKEQLLSSSLELKESQNRLSELSLSVEAHKTNLEKITEDRDRALQRAESTELELQNLKESMNGTLSVVEDMKEQLRGCKESEAHALAMVGETLSQLESAKKMVEALQLESINAEKVYNSVASELDQSRANVNLFEGLFKKLKAGELENTEFVQDEKIVQLEENEKIIQLEAELNSVKNELGVLKTALEYAEIKYNEERINSMLLIGSLNETAELTNSSFSVREAELETELSKAKADVEEMKANIMDKENELQGISEENESLHMKLEKSPGESEVEKEMRILREDIEILKGNLMDKETESQNILEENEILKTEMKRREMEDGEVEATKAREREESDRRVVRVTEQLEAVQAVNAEMEVELRRLKVQSDQWRKAAEVAAAMVSTYNDGKFVERPGSLASSYNTVGKLGSPYGGDIDDELLKKKNGNVLRKIGVLWKKPLK